VTGADEWTRRPTCQRDGCEEDALIAGTWCPGHALGRLRKQMERLEPRTSFKRGPAARPCAAGHGCQYAAVGSSTLCGRHERQMERRGRTTPIAQRRARGAALARDAQGRKECSVCLKWQALSEYAASPVQTDGLQPRCKGCVRFATYNLTPERYAAMLEAQAGVCAVCRRVDSTGRELAVDHDHSCCHGPRSCGKCVRGLLCSRCNLGVGRFGDDPARARAAATYLRGWRARGPRTVPDAPPAPRDNRWYAYRVTPDEYTAAVKAQGGGCALCGTPPGARSLAVDHDHGCCPKASTSCGRCVRGMLCANCNIGIGNFDEDPVRLDAAAVYLENALTRKDAF
jgi:hypothetical protein